MRWIGCTDESSSRPQYRQRSDALFPDSLFTPAPLMHARGGCLREPPKGRRVKRLVALAAACISLALGGCKDPSGAADSPATGLVHPAADVAIESVRTFAPNDSVAGSNDEFYIVTFTFTNDQGMSLVPRIDHFALQDIQNTKYYGIDTGNAALVGISNYGGVLKVGDSHEYTVGFRVPHDTTATLIYDNSF